MNWFKEFWRCNVGSILFTLVAVATVTAGWVLAWYCWDWLHPSTGIDVSNRDTPTDVSNSDTLRNVGFLIAGAVAFLFGIWRAGVAGRQAAAAQSQVDIGNRQSKNAERSLLNERYQRAADMLGSDVLAVRLGGIQALRRLASEFPHQYHVPVMELLCAYAVHPAAGGGNLLVHFFGRHTVSRLRRDVQSVMEAIGSRNDTTVEIERENNYKPDLSGAYLAHLQLRAGNLSGAILEKTTLEHAFLANVNLSKARLFDAKLSEANLAFANMNQADMGIANLRSAKLPQAKLNGADLSETDLADAVCHGAEFHEAIMFYTNLSGTDLSHAGQDPATGLTQSDLEGATTDNGTSPLILGCKDRLNGDRLIWTH